MTAGRSPRSQECTRGESLSLRVPLAISGRLGSPKAAEVTRVAVLPLALSGGSLDELLRGCAPVPVRDLPHLVLASIDLGGTEGVGPRNTVD